MEKGDYRKFYMHRTGHWLGMGLSRVTNWKHSWTKFKNFRKKTNWRVGYRKV
jgi:Xaa-Pro aminopeptidase